MTMNRWMMASLLLVSGMPMLPAIQVHAQPATNSPAYPWQPIARINPQKPYQVHLVNQTGIELEYSSTTNEFPPRRLTSGNRTVLTQLPLPIYLLISPVDSRFNLKYNVSATNNVITIKVSQLPEGRPGSTTVNIQETGGIYVY
jgi:serine/threonine-protein kinase